MHSIYITLWRRNIDDFLGRLVDKLTPKDNNIINIIILSICKRDNTHTITSKIIAKIFLSEQRAFSVPTNSPHFALYALP
ncbi:hypothetical protein [Moraxella lacunata]|uniref:hypothetical protein n=1 Tax=Moraxella lacunata TaxID=477 RepID=UPI003EE28468